MCKTLLLNLKLVAGATFKVTRLAPLPTDRPLIIVSNHQGTYDIPFMITVIHEHKPRFISKVELSKGIPSVSYAVRNNRSALINRTDRSQAIQAMQRAAREAERDNAAICLFPEGTRAKDGKIQKFKSAGYMTLLQEMPNALVVPVAITGSWKLLRYNFLPVPYGVTVTMTTFPPIDPAEKKLSEIYDQIYQVVSQNEAMYDYPCWIK